LSFPSSIVHFHALELLLLALSLASLHSVVAQRVVWVEYVLVGGTGILLSAVTLVCLVLLPVSLTVVLRIVYLRYGVLFVELVNVLMSWCLILILLRVVLLKFLELFTQGFLALVRVAWLKWPLRLVVTLLVLTVGAMDLIWVVCAVVVVEATVPPRFVPGGLVGGVRLVIL